MVQKLSIAAMAMMLTTTAASATTIALQPITDAIARTGAGCGGIKQQILAQGFDANGIVTGYVYVMSSCPGSGRGGKGKTYSTWVAETWNLHGVVIDEANRVPNPDPNFAEPIIPAAW